MAILSKGHFSINNKINTAVIFQGSMETNFEDNKIWSMKNNITTDWYYYLSHFRL